ncbi:MAG: putative glutamine amidotransferase [Candidatus Hydrogenedentes bacterium ADurb.Bin179]|nr:MAG: putative glutamine amidotransferase [Candidatus Hydrogenedentes bacterium ADurb.Bin179]
MKCVLFRRLSWLTILCCLFAGWAASGIAETPAVGLVYPASHYEKLTQQNEDRLKHYRTALEEQGATVLVIGQGMAEGQVDEVLKRLDGLLLPGGIDVDPARYNEAPHPKLEKTDAGLDALEWRVLEFARDNRLPVLGICRGHQVINVFYGGSLYQDIPSQHRGDTKVKHRGGKGMHEITIAKDSLLHTLLDTERYEVNTYHHQAVKTLAPGFRKTAWTDDGSIEAIESTGEVFVLGVQFHPEKLLETKPELKVVFARFVQEIRENAKALSQGRH